MRFLLAVLMGLLLAVGVGAQTSPELLQNPGFDIDADGDGIPDGWATSGGQTKRQETAYLAGNYEIASRGETYVLATQAFTLEPGKQYTLTLTARGTDGGLLGALLLHGPQRPTEEFSVLWNIEPSDRHEDYTATFTAPDPVCLLYLYNVSRKGTVYYDKVSLREGPPEQFLITQLSLPKIDRPLQEPLVTEAIPYATPLAGGPLKTFFALRTLLSRREALELTERVEVDCDLIGTGYEGDKAVSETGRRAMGRMKSDFYELFVVAGRLTPVAAQQIAAKVEAGAGLVVVEGFGQISSFMDAKQLTDAPADHVLRQGIPWEYMPEKILSSVQTGQLGKGRVVRLNFPIKTSRVWGMLPVDVVNDLYNTREFEYWEWWHSLMARAMVWAARGEAGRPKLVAGAAGVRVEGMTEGVKASVIYRSAREVRFDGPKLRLPAREVPLDKNGQLSLAAPQALPAGTVFAEVRLTNAQGRMLDWGSYALTAPQAVRLTDMTLDKETYRPDDTVKVTMKVQAGQACAARLEAKLTDAFGRLIGAGELARSYGKGARQETLSLKLARPICVQHKLFVRAIVDRREQDSRWLAVRVPELGSKLAGEDFVATTWGAGMLHPMVMEKLGELTKGLGLNSEFCIEPRLAGEHGMLSAGYSGGGGAFREDPHPVNIRRLCLSDPKVVETFREQARQSAATQRDEGLFAAGITDEAFLSYHNQRQELCLCPLCEARFRKWLQERYPSLDALNAEWGTSYTGWEQVKGTRTEEARGKDNFAPFVDFRTFMTDEWITACRQITEAYHEVAPRIPMGHTNTFGVNPFNGNDYWKLATQTGFGWGQEYSEAIKASGNKAVFELWRSFVETPEGKASRANGQSASGTAALTRETPFFNYGWIGYDRQAQAAHYEPWWLALHGSRGVSYYATVSMDESRGTSWCLIYPSLGYTAYSQAVKETLPDLREGCGKLFLEYEREQPKVAILWSHPSMLAAWCESSEDDAGEPSERPGADAYGLWNVEALSFRQHLNELQLDYQYVAPDQILGTAKAVPSDGFLKQYPLLILPVTIALQPALVEKLEAYMRAGGVIVGDLRCLRTDEHGKPNSGLLKRVFGVERLGQVDYRQTQVTVKDTAEGLDLRGKTLELYGREALQPAGATALAAHATGEPALLVMNHGQGASVYLNFALPKYDATIRELMRQIVQRAGIARAVTVENGKAEAPPRCWERDTFTRGAIAVHAFIRDHRRCEDGDPVTVNFGQTAYVYDMRARRYIGPAKSVEAKLAPGDTALYACLPYKVSALAVKAPATARAGEPLVVTATVQAAGKLGDHVLHVELLNPSGESVWHYRSNHLARAGKLELKVPLALNEQPGQWTVRVRDVLTGTMGEAKVKVQGVVRSIGTPSQGPRGEG